MDHNLWFWFNVVAKYRILTRTNWFEANWFSLKSKCDFESCNRVNGFSYGQIRNVFACETEKDQNKINLLVIWTKWGGFVTWSL